MEESIKEFEENIEKKFKVFVKSLDLDESLIGTALWNTQKATGLRELNSFINKEVVNEGNYLLESTEMTKEQVQHICVQKGEELIERFNKEV